MQDSNGLIDSFVGTDLMSRLKRFIENKSHTSVQFMKYAIAGTMVALIHVTIFTLLNETVLPADTGQQSEQRGWNFFWSFSIAFIMANFVGYLLNRRWVFQSGRHAKWVEVSFFYVVSTIAYVIGTPLGTFLVARFPLNEYLVFLMVIVSSVLVNFLGRKFVVFKH